MQDRTEACFTEPLRWGARTGRAPARRPQDLKHHIIMECRTMAQALSPAGLAFIQSFEGYHEQWRVIDWLRGYKGTLEVSDHGRVRRSGYTYQPRIGGRWRTPHTSRKPDKILSPEIGSHGYAMLAIHLNGKRNRFLVHRLVARAFVPGYREDLTVNHINGMKTDNRAGNLEWVTLARNTELQWRDGLVDLRGDAHPGRKLSSDKVRMIRALRQSGVRVEDLATQFGVSTSTIYGIEWGRRWATA